MARPHESHEAPTSKLVDGNSRRTFLKLATATGLAPAIGAVAAEPTRGDKPGTQSPAKSVCVLGASGMVGNGVVRELLGAGFRVVAVSRNSESLDRIHSQFAATGRIETLAGDVGSDEAAAQLRETLLKRFGVPDAVIAALSSRSADVRLRILDTATRQLKGAFDTNFFTHVAAARALIPALSTGGTYLGINGGLADFVVPGMGHISMTQAALNMLYQTLAQEAMDSNSKNAARVHALRLYGLVATPENSARANDRTMTDQAIGLRVVDILRNPDAYRDTLLAIKAKRYA